MSVREHNDADPIPDGANMIANLWAGQRPMPVTCTGATLTVQETGLTVPAIALFAISPEGELRPTPLLSCDLVNAERLIVAIQTSIARRRLDP